MINKLQRMKLMKYISAYYQNETVSADKKKAISEGLLANDNFKLHTEIYELDPQTETGIRLKKEIFNELEEKYYDAEQ